MQVLNGLDLSKKIKSEINGKNEISIINNIKQIFSSQSEFKKLVLQEFEKILIERYNASIDL